MHNVVKFARYFAMILGAVLLLNVLATGVNTLVHKFNDRD